MRFHLKSSCYHHYACTMPTMPIYNHPASSVHYFNFHDHKINKINFNIFTYGELMISNVVFVL